MGKQSDTLSYSLLQSNIKVKFNIYIAGYKQVRIKEDEGLSHHYRICEYGGYDCLKKPSVNDSTALKWGSQLIRRVDKTCQEIFGDKKSCPEAPPLGSPW